MGMLMDHSYLCETHSKQLIMSDEACVCASFHPPNLLSVVDPPEVELHLLTSGEANGSLQGEEDWEPAEHACAERVAF